jgi:hypothetical protein
VVLPHTEARGGAAQIIGKTVSANLAIRSDRRIGKCDGWNGYKICATGVIR